MCVHPKCIYFFHFGDPMEFAFFLCFFFLLANKIFTASVVGYCMLLYINIFISDFGYADTTFGPFHRCRFQTCKRS